MSLNPQQLTEIEQQRSQKRETIRDVSPALETLLYKAVPVLDHGFVRVVD